MYKYTVYLYRYTYTPTNINVTSLVPREAEERGGIDGQTHTYSKLGESSKPTGKGAGGVSLDWRNISPGVAAVL